MLANRLTHSLPKWEGVRFLSADSRGGVEPDAGSGENAISALSQVHEWTILDLPTSVLHPASPTHQWLPWCDAILLLSGVDTVSLANTQTRISQLPPETNFAIVAVGANNRGHLADIANQLGCGAIFGLRQQRAFAPIVSMG
ncbi:hypothetical protein [Arcanobacterium hippocoleae]|uniref:hypothetical protein n=1 Tax=Arcanobacterium hippocoleae TaxID=149017 RepID=UPI0033422E55